MTNALTVGQMQLLRLAEVGDVPVPREHRDQAYFGDVELLVLLKLMKPHGEGFALTASGAAYLEHVGKNGDAAGSR